ncbi:glycosyltransferase family protein [Gulosibacter chungangensis]|uniref:Glycosyltransferase family 39 protein n=1 Tax=Gulosibacter chungangensis TaxID=979746 RepID=A0A7J5BC96_9MICO|nr:glycosyltransferase family 39 protein [Gulosibacter chungangensis]KAB1643441.1 glycosyltransferase family 39 protein [Gulosibacter chungangensis]
MPAVRAEIPTLPTRYRDPAIDSSPNQLTRQRSNSWPSRLWRQLPTWGQLVTIYVFTRILTTALLLFFASRQADTWQIHAQPDYLSFANIWDAKWYAFIAHSGYPSELPYTEAGQVGENAWAFMPVFPLLARLISFLPGISFSMAAVLISLIAGLGTVFALHRLLRNFVSANVAMFAVFLLCIGPISPLFQVGYAEALHFWMVAVLLNLMVQRDWYAMVPLIVIASFTRPTGLALAFTLLLYILYRYWNRFVARLERFDRSEQRQLWSVAVFSGVMGLAWLVIAGIVTGQWDAYLETEFAWRRGYTSGEHTPPFTAWFWAGDYWFGQPQGTIVVLAVLILFACWFAAPVMRRFGIEIRLWAIAYTSYIFAVFYPQSSFFRILFPLFPAAAPLALPQSPVYRVLVSAAAFLAQVAWLYWMWFVIGGDWSPP